MPTPAHTEQLGALTMRTLSVSEMDNIVYLLDAGDQLLVDAADDADAVLAMLGEGRLDGPIERNLLERDFTINALALAPDGRVIDAADGTVCAHARLAGEPDADHLPVEIDRRLRHGDRLAVDGALDKMHSALGSQLGKLRGKRAAAPVDAPPTADPDRQDELMEEDYGPDSEDNQ